MLEIQHLTTQAHHFWSQLDSLLTWDTMSDNIITQTVRDILQNVRRHGDSALLDYTRQFDRRNIQNPEELLIPKECLHQALKNLNDTQRQALEHAKKRIWDYHQHQSQKSWQYTEEDGTMLGQQITPLDKVGLYVPGGKAAYPSSLLMAALPAQVAGVKEIIMVVPAPDNVLNDMLLAAASA